MTLIDVLKQEATIAFDATEALFRKVDPGTLGWKPQSGQNWLTVGQVLMHCTNACGPAVRGFITGDWGLPEGVKFEDMKPEEMLPPASKFPSVESVEQALALLADDRALTLEQIGRLAESRLLGECSAAPWGGPKVTLLQHLQHMVAHLAQHKGQLFYYLKLMGRNVNTEDLYGS